MAVGTVLLIGNASNPYYELCLDKWPISVNWCQGRGPV